MAFTSGEKEEIRQLVDDHVAPVGQAAETLRSDQQIQRETLETLAKAIERLSLVVVGDEELKIVGHGQKIELVDRRVGNVERQVGDIEKKIERRDLRETVEKTRIVWFIIGAAVAINIIFKILPWGWAELLRLLIPHP